MTIRTWAFAMVCVAGGWLATVLGVMVLTDAAPGAVVLFPSTDFVSNLPDGVAVVGRGDRWIAVRSDNAKLGLSLYRAGGRLVLPAGLPGCLPLPKSA